MNMQKFKEIVSEWDKYEERFHQFRIWEEDCYISYKKKRDQEYNIKLNNNYKGPEGYLCEWDYVYYDAVIDLYKRIGLPVDNELEQCQQIYDEEIKKIYYPVSFFNVHSKIQEIKDDIEYVYAILVLAKNVTENSDTTNKINQEYVSGIYEGVNEWDLKDAFELLDGNKVFVAMWFDDKMENARQQIEAAIRTCGCIPMLIDAKEHNDQIVPEIFKEIEKSKFVVADLTGGRGGVYYEAGYAMAKGKQVILCCKEGAEKPHFDVAQINTIFWKDEEDLRKRLINRIEATM